MINYIKRIPLLGPTLRLGYGIIRLNKIRAQIATEIADLRRLQHEVQSELQQLRTLATDTAQRQNAYQTKHDGVESQLRDIVAKDGSLASQLTDIQQAMRNCMTSVSDQANRIAGIKQEIRRLEVRDASTPVIPNAAGASSPPVSNFDHDSFYVEFEGKFRGTREDIYERLKVYLPYVQHFAQDPQAHVVDVGCGRGEWLQLLSDEKIRATGIDLNSAMVDLCREQGFSAECTDAIAWLRQQPAGSLSAVTGFHIMEHLPFEMLIALFDAALHALRDDGLIIFETPNPENLAVGAFYFYHDPTHRNPVVPAVAEFIARQRGFARAELLRLHPFGEEMLIKEESEVAKRFNDAFYGPQDFAVLAWKKDMRGDVPEVVTPSV